MCPCLSIGTALHFVVLFRYRPEITKAAASYATTTPEGLYLDIALTHDGVKLAVEPVNPHYTSATHPSVVSGGGEWGCRLGGGKGMFAARSVLGAVGNRGQRCAGGLSVACAAT